MNNIFDNLQDVAFGIVSSTMGYNAEWLPMQGGDLKTAKVLYKDATEKQSLSDIDFEAEDFQMEYKRGDFTGLKESVDNNISEKVTITIKNVAMQFFVQRVKTKYDGKTYVAKLIPV